MKRIVGIDPGTHESGFAIYEDGKVLSSGVLDNAEMLVRCGWLKGDILAIEMIASYGMAVGAEVFETVRWIGRFEQQWMHYHEIGAKVIMVYRRDVKMHLCGSMKAKDPNIRQRLIDILGPAGTKKAPGPTYGVKSHAWPALAVAVTAAQTRVSP